MACSKDPTLQICFRLILGRGLNKTYVVVLKLSFPQRPFLRKHCVLRKDQVSNTSHVLAGLVQGLFAACRIALSMVAGGKGRRRLNFFGLKHTPLMLMLLQRPPGVHFTCLGYSNCYRSPPNKPGLKARGFVKIAWHPTCVE